MRLDSVIAQDVQVFLDWGQQREAAVAASPCSSTCACAPPAAGRLYLRLLLQAMWFHTPYPCPCGCGWMQMVKIDVEGFEFNVLQGAEGLLKQHNVWFMSAECNVDIIKEAGKADFLK
jgi:hypothetical protein